MRTASSADVAAGGVRQVGVAGRRHRVEQGRLVRVLADVRAPDRDGDDLRAARLDRAAGLVEVRYLPVPISRRERVGLAGDDQRVGLSGCVGAFIGVSASADGDDDLEPVAVGERRGRRNGCAGRSRRCARRRPSCRRARAARAGARGRARRRSASFRRSPRARAWGGNHSTAVGSVAAGSDRHGYNPVRQRVSSNGKTTASQAVNVGSIPITRSSPATRPRPTLTQRPARRRAARRSPRGRGSAPGSASAPAGRAPG